MCYYNKGIRHTAGISDNDFKNCSQDNFTLTYEKIQNYRCRSFIT